jgi:hypothetical protein
MTLARSLGAVLLALLMAGSAAAQPCPDVPENAFTFIGIGNDDCPDDPGVSWPAASVIYDCDFFAIGATAVECSADPLTCIELCRQSAEIWNTGLPRRFDFIEATDPTTFCETEDGRVSVGGTPALCDGSDYGDFTLAVTLSIFFNTGPQSGQLIDANITVNQRFAFSQGSFRATLAHEFGHVLGLSHPDECGDDVNVLMRSSSMFRSTEPCFVRDPTIADIRGAERIYPVVQPVVCGDADQNGSLTVADGVQVLRAATDLPSTCAPERCDMDGNGSITVADGVHALRGAAELPFTADCP